MGEQQDPTGCTQNPPPARLGRKYIRRLLEAFEPHQDAMLADLDRQIEESNPDIVSHKSQDISRQWLNKIHQLNQVAGTDESEGTDFITLLEEIDALSKTQKMLRGQLLPTMRQNSRLKYKRAQLVELLQSIHMIRQEGHWEKIGENEKFTVEVSILGERFLTFEFSKQWLRLQAIEDIHEWMKQQRADFLPAVEETAEQATSTKKPTRSTQRKRLVATEQAGPSTSPAQIYERQAWVRLLVSAHHYSSYFQDALGELGVFVYDVVENRPQAILHLWAQGAKQQLPVMDGVTSQQEALSDSMRAWLALCWVTATGQAEENKQTRPSRKRRRDQMDEK